MLGKYLSLALMLPSGAFAGFLLGRFAERGFADHGIHSAWPTLVGIILGIVTSLVKIIQELNRDMRREERERLQSAQDLPPTPVDYSPDHDSDHG